MTINATSAGEIAGLAEAGAEAALPILIPFHPLIALVTTAVMAHFLATGQWPTTAQVLAAVPADYLKLTTTWNSWVPSGDGTLPTAAVPGVAAHVTP